VTSWFTALRGDTADFRIRSYGETFIWLHATGLLCDRLTATIHAEQCRLLIAAFRFGRLRSATRVEQYCKSRLGDARPPQRCFGVYSICSTLLEACIAMASRQFFDIRSVILPA
jgi:hypothetical protein